MSTPASRPLLRPFVILLSLVLALAGLSVSTLPAAAAEGDVAGATLEWGVKASFRSYLVGPIAHGHWTASGVTDSTPFGWSGGSGAAPGGSGAVAYAGSLQFQGHQGYGVAAEEYALDLTFSDVTVRVTSATTAELVLDARSRVLADPTTFVELNDAVIATLDLAGGTDASTSGVIAWNGVPAVLTADGATAFGGFYPAGTALDPVSFSWPVETAPEPEPVVPTISVSETTDLESGDVVTVTGTGFGPNETGGPLGTRPPLAGKFSGVYVTFGTFLDVWKPSESAPSSARKTALGATKWVVDADDVATIGGAAAGAIAIDEDGSFSVEIAVTDNFAGALADGNYGIYTYPGSGATYAPFETFTPISFATETTPTAPPVDPVTTPAPGSLGWGIKASFREYVTGPIANGSISVSSGAGVAGGGYWFPQSSAGVTATTVDIAYRGAVTFTGHSGALNLRIADPGVRITSATAAVLSVATGSGRVDFATLNLGAATATTDASGARTYTSTPATLTSAGAASFDGFYAAGTALDPVTFTIGSANVASGRTSTTSAASAATHTPDATPPATEGIDSEQSDFTEGEEGTFTAAGFLPGESGILAVIYSEPTVLATNVTADADGAVTWRGNLPTGLTGEHTFTFQGSVDRGIVLDIAAADVVGCTVEGAELTWGFKESFRAYIDGSIANGEWATADGATYETPAFGWANGTGGYDAETEDADLAFTGSVRFTGHGGVLDTTIANPRVVIEGNRAVLLLDVTGTTQDGAPVSSVGVEFAELDLDAAERAGGGDLIAFTSIPAVLTDAGAAAFGTYPAGEALDPLDLSITVDPACGEAASTTTSLETSVDSENASAVSSWPWIVGALVVLLIAAAIVILTRRARRV
ncbi:HtaA domain-containing protein [Pseudolysinimonas sp.]|uniref:HtaA domain-containing protein n=1 Tax=Pseudolysinimonas sp. TaxID=2680009 RepID=UPI00286CF380|nr:HtaA domain-containing protein [Pseudolysinimonas sp.]